MGFFSFKKTVETIGPELTLAEKKAYIVSSLGNLSSTKEGRTF